MRKQDILNTVLDVGIIPIVRTDTAEQAESAIEAIHHAGIHIAEITMTVPHALKLLEKICDRFGDELILGAGTVLNAATARDCMLAGAEFCVSPVLDLPTVEMCNRYSKCVFPGALTPTEILSAWDAGASMVKVFPVGVLGGPSYIKALKAPLPQVLLLPTGGVTLGNASKFFEAGASAVAVGSELVNRHWLVNREFRNIENVARGFLQIVAESRAA